MTGELLSPIIKKHNAVALSHGSVWFAIRGRALSDKRLQTLREQVQRSTPTFFYVLQRRAGTIQVFQSPILALNHAAPEADYQLIPPYYDMLSMRSNALLWLRVGRFGELRPAALDLFYVQATGNPLMNALIGMSSLIIVSERSTASSGVPQGPTL